VPAVVVAVVAQAQPVAQVQVYGSRSREVKGHQDEERETLPQN